MSDPARVLEGPGSVARRTVGRKRLYRVEGNPGEPALYVKVFPRARGLRQLLYLLRPSKAWHEASIARRVSSRSFVAALPVAVGEERRFGLLGRSFSVIPELDARDLRAILTDPATPAKERRVLAESFGAFLRRLHDAGIDQDDPLPNNFLVKADQSFVLIDFERCHTGAPLGPRRWRLLAKLHRDDLGVSLADRLRFLRAYLGPPAERAARRAAWQQIRKALMQVRATAARHAARGAFREGRRLRREAGVWQVRGREQGPVRRLALGTRGAREVWVRAHQLERLRLPSLRPVRLGPDWVELEDPGVELASESHAQQIERSARRFRGYGEFVGESQWVVTADGAKLCDPRAFSLGR